MARMRALAVTLALLAVTACNGPAGKDVGGDGNPLTGECKVEFEETVSGTPHRYPEMLDVEQRLVVGKVIFTCDKAPRTHNATAYLEKRRQGAGADWRTVDIGQMSRIPRPKDSIFLRGTCEFGQTEYWRVRVEVNGTIEQADGTVDAFAMDDSSREARVTCRQKR
jgi:hypothetical protein